MTIAATSATAVGHGDHAVGDSFDDEAFYGARGSYGHEEESIHGMSGAYGFEDDSVHGVDEGVCGSALDSMQTLDT